MGASEISFVFSETTTKLTYKGNVIALGTLFLFSPTNNRKNANAFKNVAREHQSVQKSKKLLVADVDAASTMKAKKKHWKQTFSLLC